MDNLTGPDTPEDLASHDCLIYSYLSTANVWRFTAPEGREIPVAFVDFVAARFGKKPEWERF